METVYALGLELRSVQGRSDLWHVMSRRLDEPNLVGGVDAKN